MASSKVTPCSALLPAATADETGVERGIAFSIGGMGSAANVAALSPMRTRNVNPTRAPSAELCKMFEVRARLELVTRPGGRIHANMGPTPVMLIRRAIVPFLLLSAACSRAPAGNAGAGASPQPEGPGLGEVMAQVGRRFEVAGRAAEAGRFQLADFEVGELEELFEGDVPRAALPKEGPTAHIPAMAQSFLKVALPELKQAAAKNDRVAFAEAFGHAAAQCNGCHQASAKAFIEIPLVPGKAVPSLDPK
jgi:hypothetical protein